MQMTTTPDPLMLGDYWMINYDAQRALQSFHFLKVLLGRPPRVYVSEDCAAIITSNLPLKLIREPHVREWQESFRELSAEEFVMRVAEIVNGTRRNLIN